MKDSQTKQVEQPAKNEPTPEIEKLLAFLAQYGGEIVSTAKLSPEWIEQARASGRLYVDEKSLGYVWEPDIDGFPTTEQKVEEFEKWYPLPVELPEKFKNGDWLFDKLHEKKAQPVNGDDAVKVDWQYNKIVLTNPKGDTYTSVSEELMDFLWFCKNEIQFKAAPKGDDVIRKEEILESALETFEANIPEPIKEVLHDLAMETYPVRGFIRNAIKEVLENNQFKSAPQAVKWVQAKERLPELPPPYYEDGCKLTPVTNTAIVYDGETVFTESYDKDGFRNKYITHWMYMPLPPNENNPGKEWLEGITDKNQTK